MLPSPPKPGERGTRQRLRSLLHGDKTLLWPGLLTGPPARAERLQVLAKAWRLSVGPSGRVRKPCHSCGWPGVWLRQLLQADAAKLELAGFGLQADAAAHRDRHVFEEL